MPHSQSNAGIRTPEFRPCESEEPIRPTSKTGICLLSAPCNNASHPHAITDRGVTLLLQHWGGEGVYFWLEDPVHIEQVQSIGRARIIEVAVPLSVTTSAYSAAKAVVATYITSLGAKPDWPVFDLYTTSALGANAVLNLHTEGDPAFEDMARGYPVRFVDFD